MEKVSYFSTLMLPPEPTWKGTFYRSAVNFSEWIFSFPLYSPSYEYTAHIELTELPLSTLQKTLQVMLSFFFIYVCKVQPFLIGLSLLPKIYNRTHLPEPPPLKPLPTPHKSIRASTLKRPEVDTSLPTISKKENEHVKQFLALADFHIRHQQYNAALHAISAAPYDSFIQAPKLALKKLQIYVCLKENEKAAMIAEVLYDTLSSSPKMEKLLPKIVHHLLEGGLVDQARKMVVENPFPEATSNAQFRLVSHYISKGNLPEAKIFIDTFDWMKHNHLLLWASSQKQYGIILTIMEEYPLRHCSPSIAANCYINTGQNKKAEEILEKHADHLKCNHSMIYYARTLRMLGRHGEALVALQNHFFELEKDKDVGVMLEYYQSEIAQFFYEEKDEARLCLILDSFTYYSRKENILTLLMNLYAEQGRPDLVEKLIQERCKNMFFSSFAIPPLVKAHLKKDEVKLAEKAIKKIAGSYEHDKALALIVQYFVNRKEFEMAKVYLGQIKTPRYYIGAEITLAEGYMYHGKNQEGLKCANIVLDDILAYPLE